MEAPALGQQDCLAAPAWDEDAGGLGPRLLAKLWKSPKGQFEYPRNLLCNFFLLQTTLRLFNSLSDIGIPVQPLVTPT